MLDPRELQQSQLLKLQLRLSLWYGRSTKLQLLQRFVGHVGIYVDEIYVLFLSSGIYADEIDVLFLSSDGVGVCVHVRGDDDYILDALFIQVAYVFG